jgi:hypothetical protein
MRARGTPGRSPRRALGEPTRIGGAIPNPLPPREETRCSSSPRPAGSRGKWRMPPPAGRRGHRRGYRPAMNLYSAPHQRPGIITRDAKTGAAAGRGDRWPGPVAAPLRLTRPRRVSAEGRGARDLAERRSLHPRPPRRCAMTTTNAGTAAERYAARVDAVLAQRTRLRGSQPPRRPSAADVGPAAAARPEPRGHRLVRRAG